MTQRKLRAILIGQCWIAAAVAGVMAMDWLGGHPPRRLAAIGLAGVAVSLVWQVWRLLLRPVR
jgi:hypothetical protein